MARLYTCTKCKKQNFVKVCERCNEILKPSFLEPLIILPKKHIDVQKNSPRGHDWTKLLPKQNLSNEILRIKDLI